MPIITGMPISWRQRGKVRLRAVASFPSTPWDASNHTDGFTQIKCQHIHLLLINPPSHTAFSHFRYLYLYSAYKSKESLAVVDLCENSELII